MISIVIPVYNKEKYVGKCIESILNQTYKDYELILVDDGSTDDSLNVLKQYHDKRVKVFSKKNEGVSCTRNYGLKKTTMPYILFIDADDYLEPDMLEVFVSVIKKYDADLITCGFFSETINGTKEEFKYKNAYFKGKEGIKKNLMHLYDNDLMYNPCNKIYKKSIIDKNKLKFPNIIFGEDNSFNIEYLKCCDDVYNVGRCLYHYVRELENSITMRYVPNFFNIRLKENKSFIELFQYYGIDEEVYEKYISKRFIERTVGCLENIHRKNNLSIKDKLNQTREIIKNEETKKYLKIYKSNNKIINLTLKTYEFKSPIFAFIMGYAFNRAKKIFPKAFNKFKNKR